VLDVVRRSCGGFYRTVQSLCRGGSNGVDFLCGSCRGIVIRWYVWT